MTELQKTVYAEKRNDISDMSDMCMVLFVYSIDYPPVIFHSLPWEARANLKMFFSIELDGLWFPEQTVCHEQRVYPHYTLW